MAHLPFSLYIHIPYCVSKCPYCDFNSHVVADIPEVNYVNALLRELEHYGETDDWRGRTVQSIFFGGGTPSTFKPQSIGKLLAWVAATFSINLDCEITLEANPGTVDGENFAGYRDAGVNRISVGVQSFQPRLLKFLGRVHGANEARKALSIVRQAGFENFSLDLIYANPGQTLEDLEAAASFRLQSHLRRRHAVSSRISRRPDEIAQRRRGNRHGRDGPEQTVGCRTVAL
jgi:putative oxygen-independent coproporphyrinogen III oxidase